MPSEGYMVGTGALECKIDLKVNKLYRFKEEEINIVEGETITKM
jgi:hypothetical protein